MPKAPPRPENTKVPPTDSCSAAQAPIRRRVARSIRLYRLIRGWTQEDLAEAAGLHRTYIGSIERGERNIGLDSLERLARALSVPAADLLRSGSSLGIPESIDRFHGDEVS